MPGGGTLPGDAEHALGGTAPLEPPVPSLVPEFPANPGQDEHHQARKLRGPSLTAGRGICRAAMQMPPPANADGPYSFLLQPKSRHVISSVVSASGKKSAPLLTLNKGVREPIPTPSRDTCLYFNSAESDAGAFNNRQRPSCFKQPNIYNDNVQAIG